MNAKISEFLICVEAIIYLSLCYLHDYTFKGGNKESKTTTIVTAVASILP